MSQHKFPKKFKSKSPEIDVFQLPTDDRPTSESTPNQLRKEISQLNSYLQNLSSWLLQVSSRSPPPALKSPNLRTLRPISQSLEELKSSVFKLKESCKLQSLEYSIRELTAENKKLHKKLHHSSSRAQRLNSDEKKKDDFLLYQAEFNSLKREIDGLKNDVIQSCSSLHFILSEAEQNGLYKPKNRIEGLKGYVQEVKLLVSSLNQSSVPRPFHSKHASDFELTRAEYNERLIEGFLKVLHPLTVKCQVLQDRDLYFSKYFRHLHKVLSEEKTQIRSLLDLEESKAPAKFKVAVIAVLACFRFNKLKKHNKDTMNYHGIKISPIPHKVNLSIKTKSLPSARTVYDLFDILQNKYGKAVLMKNNWNCLMSYQIKEFKQFMNDTKSILQLLLEDNMKLKQHSNSANLQYKLYRLKNLQSEKEDAANNFQDTADYIKQLEQQVMHMANEQIDPEELEDILVELESHKKALKGLTSQYNLLERERDELKQQINK